MDVCNLQKEISSRVKSSGNATMMLVFFLYLNQMSLMSLSTENKAHSSDQTEFKITRYNNVLGFLYMLI